MLKEHAELSPLTHTTKHADLVNLAIVVDRLDPIVRLVSLISSPIKRAAGAVWRLLLRYRVAL